MAKGAGVTLHGTGIHPGGITERFPLMISALSGSITHVRAEEFSDIRTYGAPDVVRDWMLFGKTPEEARTSIMADALGAGFRQSVFMVADELGFDIEPRLRTTHEMAVATAPIDSPDRCDPTGHGRRATVQVGGAGRRRTGDHRGGQLAHGRGTPRSRLEVRPAPASASRSRSPAIRVASPRSRSCTRESVEAGLARNPGIVATALHCVNAIPYVCAAEPGLAHLPRPAARRRAAPSLESAPRPARAR